MSRLRDLTPETMTPEQRRVYDNIVAGPRGAFGGPFAAMIRNPVIADPAQELGAAIRYRGALPGRLRELAILITARRWTAQFEWYAHASIARAEGLDESVIAAIAARERPEFVDPDAEQMYEFCSKLLEAGRVDEALYEQTRERFGESGVMELVGIAGYYTLIAFTLNTFEVPVPEGDPPLQLDV